MDIEMMLKQNHISFKYSQEAENFDKTNENLSFNNLIKNDVNDISFLTNSINDNNDNFVKIDFNKIISLYQMPLDIRNDIIYCQKSLINYLKVHQIVITRYGDKIFEIPLLKHHLDCLENDIYQINAEQNFFLLRLHKSLQDFYEISAKNILIDENITNAYISKIFATYIENLNYHCTPSNAKRRKKPQTLLQRFGLYENQGENITDVQFSSNQLKNSHNFVNGVNNVHSDPKQISLLKPKSEWPINSKEIRFEESLTELTSYSTELNSYSTELNSSFESTVEDVIIKSEPDNSSDNMVNHETETEAKSTHKLGTSVSINNSRMNLLQALNKAKKQTLLSNVNAPQQHQKEIPDPDVNAHICANILKKKTSFDGNKVITNESNESEIVKKEITKPADKVQPMKIKTRSSDLNKVEKKSCEYVKKDDNIQCSSNTPSSEESLDYLDLYPHLSKEIPEPSELNQEQFLRYFSLYTDEYSNFLKQRRSKRRRRIVQSNEKKEYHYGNIDPKAISQLQKEKRKKIFLASPPAKRKRIDNAANDERKKEIVLCVVCSKNGDSGLSKCEFCSKYFHTKCHTGAFSRKPVLIRSKICPPCYKVNPKKIRELISVTTDDLKKQRYTTLIGEAEECNKKLKLERSRKESLINKRKFFKLEMNNIISLVEKIKNNSNDDNSKSEAKYNFHAVFLEETDETNFLESSGNTSTDKSKSNENESYLNSFDDNDDSDGAMVIDEDYDTETK